MEKHKNTKAKPVRGVDTSLVLIIIVLVVFGLVMVYSASAPSANFNEGNQYHFVVRQAIFATLGFASMFILSCFDYHNYKKFALPMLVGAFLLLFTVYIPGLGVVSNGARRWIGYGVFSLQPSEVAKVAVIIYFAYSLSIIKDDIQYFGRGLLRYLIILGAFALVLMLEPHFSGTVVICATAVVMLIVAGAKMKHFGILSIPLIPVLIYVFKEPYRLKRIFSFLDPFADKSDSGYQVVQSLYAIGSGGLFGLGLGQSHQKYLYIPEPQNDFIFSIICEELGWVGAIAVVVMFSILIWRGFRIAQDAPDTFGSLLCVGITTLIAVQVAINIAVVTSSVPVTGMALPFFSYGGTSLFILMSCMGILLNVSRQSVQRVAKSSI